MARLLVAQGYSVLLPDSFSARGESSICEQKMKDRKVRTSDRRDDVSGALDWLAQQHWSNAQKVALLGWSHGASTALASINALDPMVSARELQPSLTIAFYPGCSGLLRSGFKPLTPLLMLLGELDDWTPAGPCVELAKRVHARVEVYPNSHHDFDNPVGSVRLRTEVPNGEHPGMGVHAGRNPITGPQAWKTVVDTLASQWGLLITPRNSTAQ
jgi:dienelactone hydrolase